jgi:hypothetical protein
VSAAPDEIVRPTVTAGDVFNDTAWFDANPRRRYRICRATAGGWWLVRRRRGRVFLRAWAARLPRMPDNDEAIRPFWFFAAWPALPADTRAELVKEARKLEHGQ